MNEAALVWLFGSGDPLREMIGGMQLGWCIMRSRISFRRGFRCAFPSGDSLTLTSQLCCAVCACLGSRARQAAMAVAIAPDSSPCNALSDHILQGPLRPVTRSHGLARGRHRSDAHSSFFFPATLPQSRRDITSMIDGWQTMIVPWPGLYPIVIIQKEEAAKVRGAGAGRVPKAIGKADLKSHSLGLHARPIMQIMCSGARCGTAAQFGRLKHRRCSRERENNVQWMCSVMQPPLKEGASTDRLEASEQPPWPAH
jgi:hypothetical protein